MIKISTHILLTALLIKRTNKERNALISVQDANSNHYGTMCFTSRMERGFSLHQLHFLITLKVIIACF